MPKKGTWQQFSVITIVLRDGYICNKNHFDHWWNDKSRDKKWPMYELT